ncbi:MFS transporter [Klebsiella pneumoniae subsp. pneumoniae]|nr:MFS transporter [Klebsiella pneumoniae subsp. pneumoniae]
MPDTSNRAYALRRELLWSMPSTGVPADLLMRRIWRQAMDRLHRTLLWGVLVTAAMAWADTEARKFLLVRTAGRGGGGLCYILTSQWFPQQSRASIMRAVLLPGAPLALTLGSRYPVRCFGAWIYGPSQLVLDVCRDLLAVRRPGVHLLPGWTIRRPACRF